MLPEPGGKKLPQATIIPLRTDHIGLAIQAVAQSSPELAYAGQCICVGGEQVASARSAAGISTGLLATATWWVVRATAPSVTEFVMNVGLSRLKNVDCGKRRKVAADASETATNR